MLKPWNNASLLPPPVNMFLCSYKFDLSDLRHVVNNIHKVLSKQSPLHKEGAICSRFIYKYDKKFQNDIGYRNLRKVNTALKKYLSLNLLKDIENFIAALPSVNEDELYLPTRQMLEYVMLRIIAFSKIMLRICVCSKQAAVFYLNRVKRGESHWMSLLPYALLSRIWSMSMVLLQHSTTWYSNLYTYLNKLQLKGLPFLPDNYELPQDLEQWLDLKNIDNFGRFEWAQRKNIDVDSSLIEDDDSELLDNIIDYVNKMSKDEEVLEEEDEIQPLLVKPVPSIDPIQVTKPMTIDHGVALSRESFKSLLQSTKVAPPPPPPREKYVEHTYKKITSTEDLKAFLDREEELRNDSNRRSSTKHLSLMQWHSLKNSLLQQCDTESKRKLNKTFHRIWKEKCLDYLD
ncbi:unnamed protein product [Chrysodeixis includens]|uniref:Nucleolus and neural progenitor protein-like N-terminal domain-containing protein n=1 Tax=Chrysodeixis includens TaxID=689277 RepID=A0A9N8Q0Y4_CHRIL|nr:unnamed protein product [Chrysodeixis includens]